MRRTRTRTLAVPYARIAAVAAVWIALFAYAARPVVFAAVSEGLARAAAWGIVVALSMLPLLPFLVRRDRALRSRSAMYWIGYATSGVFAMLLVLVFVGDLVRLSLAVLRTVAAVPMIPAQILNAAILAGAALLSVIGFAQAHCPRVRRVEVAIDDLPHDLDGYTIAQWSDVHIGPTIRRRFVASLVERTNALGADAIAITGDLVDGHLDEIREQVAPLRDLSARDGVWFVTGNHEYYWHADEWTREIERLGITFLKNEHRVIRRGAAKLVIAGVTDPAGGHSHKPDPAAAVAGAPDGAVKILLAHRPQAAAAAKHLGVHLQLSGHTHGGQFFPFSLLIHLFQPVVRGLHRDGQLWLYVSRGTGYWGPPSRLGVGGEISLITLRRR